jgi:N-acetylglutamate synthase-like GNAT family acetyltransferase
MSEKSTVTIAGEKVTIRPIRLTDIEMESEFIHRLSPETKHFRFLAGMRELPAQELARFCDVDMKHSMAFVATVHQDGREVEIGVSRYAPNSHFDVREVAVTVADEWQQKGLSASLMNQLIKTARIQGIKQLYSVNLSDDTEMSALATQLGMSSIRDPSDPHQTIHSLTL